MALALAGCGGDFDLGDFIRDVLAFDEGKDYLIAGGVVVGGLGVLSAFGGGGGDSGTSSGGGASTPQSPSFSTDTATATATENATAVAYTLNATDPDNGDTLTYSLKPNTGDVALFSITSAGVLSFKTAPDYESPPSDKTTYTVTVIASDGDSTTANAEQTVAITLNNVNEAPSFATDTATATAIAENSSAGQTIYTPTSATDPEGDTIAYSLKDTGDHSAFTINAGTGAVTLTGDPNFETKPSYAFTIVATDTGGLTDELPVTLDITNVNEAPAFATDTATATADENATVVTYTLNATDPDGDTLTYSLKPNTGDVALFSITSAGALSFKTAPDYESPPSSKTTYSVTVIASDGNSATADAEQTVAITLTNINEGQAGFTLTPTFLANGNITLTASKTSDDPDGNGTFTYEWGTIGSENTYTSIAGQTSSSFTEDTFQGTALRMTVSYTDGGDNMESATVTNYIVVGNANSNILGGSEGDNAINGGGGNDDMFGYGGNDILFGGAGNDQLEPGAGIDIMTGGAGNDRFLLELSAGSRAKDVVTDFTSGDEIRVDVTGAGNTITVDTLAKIRDDVDIRWTNNTKETTGTSTNDASTNDTVIYYTNGTATTSDDEIVMVLEDYTTDLVFADFYLT